jgi:hypothetical protein
VVGQLHRCSPHGYQVPWTEFRNAFRAHHIPTDIMKRKHEEFMSLKQGGRSVYDYLNLFNHLAQYAPVQVDTDEKEKDYFVILISNSIITDDAIHAHKESKKRKNMAVSSGSAPTKY